jgi:hypothetical protein
MVSQRTEHGTGVIYSLHEVGLRNPADQGDDDDGFDTGLFAE